MHIAGMMPTNCKIKEKPLAGLILSFAAKRTADRIIRELFEEISILIGIVFRLLRIVVSRTIEELLRIVANVAPIAPIAVRHVFKEDDGGDDAATRAGESHDV